MLVLAQLLLTQSGIAQQCSNEALTAKYWQYRGDLKHFVMNDRKPEGCIGNGITRTESDLSQLSCGTDLLHGYGFPATSIVMVPDGGHVGMIDRNDEVNNPIWYDPDCANYPNDPTINGTSYPGNGAGNAKHNFLEYGSETPHQIGWYLTVLATEYALLGKNGQIEEQQKTLEDLFLALQAYRRLDITANCLVKERYDEITDGFEVEDCSIQVWANNYTDPCLCPDKYFNNQCKNEDREHVDSKWHFDIPCKENCPWQPNLSGYSGFFVRADATQEQEALHDPSEDKWNIDLVGSAFAMSQKPPCSSTFSQACYMERVTGYLSQDQMFAIMKGLAIVKRYIPDTATVTTCDGVEFSPLSIAQDIAKGMVKLPQNGSRHIFWPGSDDDDCCYKSIKFGECAGGNLQWTYAALEMMYNYINPDEKHKVGWLDYQKFYHNALLMGEIQDPNFNFAINGFLIGTNSGMNPKMRTRLYNYSTHKDKEIYLLINNLLYPESPNFTLNRQSLEAMLCAAPCGGVCIKPANWDGVAAAGTNWPEFSCANTPKWTGQRWEGDDAIPDWDPTETYLARQLNGLDYMALYNIYMLHYPSEQTPFYPPSGQPATMSYGNVFGEDKIEGPYVLCPGQWESYLFRSSYSPPSTLQEIVWESSNNVNLSSTSANPTLATSIGGPKTAHIGVSFQESRTIPQYHSGVLATPTPPLAFVPVADVCEFNFTKPLVSRLIDYEIEDLIDPCFNNYKAQAIPSGGALEDYLLPEIAFTWNAYNYTNQQTATSTGRIFDYGSIVNPAEWCDGVDLTLQVNSCGEQIIKTASIDCTPCWWYNRQVVITPNPAGNQISVRVTNDQAQDFVSTDPNGVRIRIYPASGGTTPVLDSYLYSNGQIFNTSSIPNGLYAVVATASDLPPIQANLAIIH
jgi:hypothetical protein